MEFGIADKLIEISPLQAIGFSVEMTSEECIFIEVAVVLCKQKQGHDKQPYRHLDHRGEVLSALL